MKGAGAWLACLEARLGWEQGRPWDWALQRAETSLCWNQLQYGQRKVQLTELLWPLSITKSVLYQCHHRSCKLTAASCCLHGYLCSLPQCKLPWQAAHAAGENKAHKELHIGLFISVKILFLSPKVGADFTPWTDFFYRQKTKPITKFFTHIHKNAGYALFLWVSR